MTLRVGTRRSALAWAQASALLARVAGEVELVPIVSGGDRTTASLASLGGAGVFVASLREALLAGEVDAVVHSAKDLPTAPLDGVELLVMPEREDPRDALVTRDGGGLSSLAAGARVGTGSPRRRAQVLRSRPDLTVVDIRGNIDTRLARVLDPADERPLDAVVLATAGLVRLDRTEVIAERFDADAWPTAPAQGVLAVEVRSEAPEWVREILRPLEDPVTRAEASLEREVLRLLEAGCAAPLGVSAVGDRVVAEAYAPDGLRAVRGEQALPTDAGRVVAALIQGGAAELLS